MIELPSVNAWAHEADIKNKQIGLMTYQISTEAILFHSYH